MVFQRPFAGFFFSEYSHVPEFAKNKSVSLRVADGNGEVSRKKPSGEWYPPCPEQHRPHIFPQLPLLSGDTLTSAARRTLKVQLHRVPYITLEKPRSKRIANRETSQSFPAHCSSTKHVDLRSWLCIATVCM